MKNILDLNQIFGKHSTISFREISDEIIVANIDNAFATPCVSLYGGCIMYWQTKSLARLVLWLSALVKFQGCKVIGGGVPICWPWFGAHPINASPPSLGYARITQ